MSNEVFTREEVTLQDGVVVELRPLVISKKRKFMKIWSDHIASVQSTIKEATKRQEASELAGEGDGDDPLENFDFDENELNERQYDVYVKLSSMCLEDIKGDRTEKQFVSYLEDTLDEPTIFKILEVSGGLNLTDSPN